MKIWDGMLRGMPIRWKIVAMMLSVTALSLVLAGAGLLLHTRAVFERQLEQRLNLLANVIGINNTAALAFDDAAAATETLGALSSNASIVTGGLYDMSERGGGRLFARYVRANTKTDIWLPPIAPATDSWRIGDGHAMLVHTVVYKGKALGKVILVIETGEWRDMLANFLAITGVLFGAVLIVGFFVSMAMQRGVTRPITELSELMRRIGHEGDYSLRANKTSEDEIGTLVDGFNAMLSEIAKSRGEIEQARDALRQLNEELEQRVHDRTQQLEAANKELEAFSYSVSHDLRAPLRAIDGFSRVLMDDPALTSSEVGRDSLFRVRRAAQRMGTLIDDMLKLARVTRTAPTLEQVNLSELAQEVAENLQQTAERKVSFSVAPRLMATGDAHLLRVALENLLGNAWKFSGARAEPKVELGAKVENGIVIYFVRDNGAGFDMAYADKLFAPFQRLHSASEFPGTGVGLATVQRVIRKHGGSIWAESSPDNGATFYFTLTASAAESTIRRSQKQ